MQLTPRVIEVDTPTLGRQNVAKLCRTSAVKHLFGKGGGEWHKNFVGGSGLHVRDWAVPKFEIGYWCRKTQQRRGLITEAVRAITRFAVSELKARRIECRSDEENFASRRVCECAGYQLEGILRHDRVGPTGELRNTCSYAYIP